MCGGGVHHGTPSASLACVLLLENNTPKCLRFSVLFHSFRKQNCRTAAKHIHRCGWLFVSPWNRKKIIYLFRDIFFVFKNWSPEERQREAYQAAGNINVVSFHLLFLKKRVFFPTFFSLYKKETREEGTKVGGSVSLLRVPLFSILAFYLFSMSLHFLFSLSFNNKK